MPKHDLTGLFSPYRQPKISLRKRVKENAVLHECLEVHEPGECRDEQHGNEAQSRWHRFKQHPAFKPVLGAGGIAALGVVTLLTVRSPEEPEQSGIGTLDHVSDFTGTDTDGIDREVSRRSPSPHRVSGHPRTQHYGIGGTETKIVQIPPYSRGGEA